jgi:hypothetical protein
MSPTAATTGSEAGGAAITGVRAPPGAAIAAVASVIAVARNA